MEFDEIDLNRLYEALVTQIETYNGDPDWKEELVALKELNARIGTARALASRAKRLSEKHRGRIR